MSSFLLGMKFTVDTCDRCGEPIYSGDDIGWLNLTGTQPKQGLVYHAVVYCGDSDDGEPSMSWTLDQFCWNTLTKFA